MIEIIKRLEIIKNGIAIEEVDLIELQIVKLKSLKIDDAILEIIESLEKRDYAQAVKAINEYIYNNTSVTVYVDSELSALRLELKLLNEKLAKTETQKIEYLMLIDSFYKGYTIALGDYIQNILDVKKQIAQKQFELNPEKESNKEEYEQAEEKYQSFEKEFKKTVEEKTPELSSEDKAELKKLYLESAKMCHPDAVSENKEKAEEVFKKLNEAREKNDLKTVREIYESLKRGDAFGVDSEKIDDKELLKEKIDSLKNKIAEIEKEIADIFEDSTYKLIVSLDDWDDYFDDLKKQLENELLELQLQRDKLCLKESDNGK
ncbi:MAG: DnaJ domain-containing protein [Desulfamplus sp.]|nr:DnaJ domain-containing protein [Desulfamplus sp.]